VTNENTRLQRNAEMVDSAFDDEVVMMSVENGEYYGLDEIASVIWEKLEQEKSLSGLLDELLALYDVERDTCKNDVIAFLHSEVGSKVIVQIDD